MKWEIHWNNKNIYQYHNIYNHQFTVTINRKISRLEISSHASTIRWHSIQGFAKNAIAFSSSTVEASRAAFLIDIMEEYQFKLNVSQSKCSESNNKLHYFSIYFGTCWTNFRSILICIHSYLALSRQYLDPILKTNKKIRINFKLWNW